MNLEKILNSVVSFEDTIQHRPPKKIPITENVLPERNNLPSKFEADTLNFLLEKRKELGIKSLYRLKNAYVDGYIILENRKGIAIEFKYALNWNKNNVARSQIFNFKQEAIHNKLGFPVPYAGLIFFQNFSGDWARIQGARAFENGWYRFYQDQKHFDQLVKIHVL